MGVGGPRGIWCDQGKDMVYEGAMVLRGNREDYNSV